MKDRIRTGLTIVGALAVLAPVAAEIFHLVRDACRWWWNLGRAADRHPDRFV